MLLASLLFLGTLEAVESDASRQKIIRALQQWPEDFNAKKVEAVCGLFAKDLVASYPGTEDANYDRMCEKLTEAMNDPKKSFHYAAPEIEQVILGDEVAAVRLIWTLTITADGKTETIREKGLDVFKRQRDGTWKIAVSYAYPL